METGARIAVVGGTGRIGGHTVELLQKAGHDAVALSRATGVDVITGSGLAEALAGVKCIVDASTGPSPDERAATEFFTASTRNLHDAGRAAGVQRLVIVSIIGCDRFSGGYNAAKVVQERAALVGPIPARILRAAQFHEFVEVMLQWSTDGDVAHMPAMRTQLVAARTAAEALVDLTLAPDHNGAIPEIAGPRAERLVEMARLLAARRGGPQRIEEASDPAAADSELFATDGLLPSPHGKLAGPTFEEWLG